MSGVKPRAKRAAKPKHDADSSHGDDSGSESGAQTTRGRPPARNATQNEIVKSKLIMIVDLLSCSDEEVDERALRRNTAMATKHLSEIIKGL